MIHSDGAAGAELQPATRGSVFGFDVVSNLPFTYLRAASGGDRLLVSERTGLTVDAADNLIKEWAAVPGKRNHTRLWRRSTSTIVEVGREHVFRLDPECTAVDVSETPQLLRREMLLFGTPAALCMTRRGDVAFHGSSVEVGDQAVLFAAPGMFGKTTLAAAFVAAGHRALSDDLTCVDPAQRAVQPGPAVVRIRQDVAGWLGPIANTSIAYEDPGKVHLSLDGSARGSGSPVALAGIALLRQGDEVGVTPHRPADAIRDLRAVAFSVGTPEAELALFDRLARLVTDVPVWNLTRPMRIDTLPAVIELAETLAERP